MIKVDVLIVTFKRKELLVKVLYGVLEQSHSINKIIVIDNNSNDGTGDVVTEISTKTDICIEYHNTGANLGGAGGFSYGFEKALESPFDYLWIMDDDLLPAKNCLELLLSKADENKIVQPIRYNLDGTCAEYSPVIFDLSSVFLMRPKTETVLQRISNNHEDEISLNGIPFEGPLISRKIIETVGLPDKRFFIFYDDLDYAIRARDAGFKISCKTDAIAQRLLFNNQVTDLQSWKGYFMLRNFFRIHRMHGRNSLVRNRPILLALIYIFKELFLFRKKRAIICWHALLDSMSKNFKLRSQYIP